MKQELTETKIKPVVHDILVPEEVGDKTYWRVVGVAFVMKSGGYSMRFYERPGTRYYLKESVRAVGAASERSEEVPF